LIFFGKIIFNILIKSLFGEGKGLKPFSSIDSARTNQQTPAYKKN
jgi:hypothetical protein